MTDSTQDPVDTSAPISTTDADWAAALAEQTAKTPGAGATQADGLADAMAGSAEDDWAAALAEQAGTASAPAPSPPSADPSAAGGVPAVAPHMFAPLASSDSQGNSDIDMIMDIPVQLSVELGRTRLTIRNILQLGQGSVVELDGLAGEPMDIYVNGYLIAQGEVVVVEDKYGIRVTDIITPADRISRLNSRR